MRLLIILPIAYFGYILSDYVIPLGLILTRADKYRAN